MAEHVTLIVGWYRSGAITPLLQPYVLPLYQFMVTPLTSKPLLSHFALHQKLIEDDTLKNRWECAPWGMLVWKSLTITLAWVTCFPLQFMSFGSAFTATRHFMTPRPIFLSTMIKSETFDTTFSDTDTILILSRSRFSIPIRYWYYLLLQVWYRYWYWY